VDDNRVYECISTRRAWRDGYAVLARAAGRVLQDSPESRDAVGKLKLEPSAWLEKHVTEERLLTLLDERLCDTCNTFGSVHLASPLAFHDLPVIPGEWHEIFQVRDGVGIDRDSERARSRIKFDFEVVPPGTAFAFSVAMESPSPEDCQLVAVGLHEFVGGMVAIGGIRSRGLGRCRLEEVSVAFVDFGDPAALRRYLLSRSMDEEAGGLFIARHLEVLLAARES
jgi:hypothetical protein